MKRVKERLAGVVTAVLCGLSAIAPIGASAEGLFPENENAMAASYSTADINRNGSVDITDVLVVNQVLNGTRYIANNSLADTNRNRVISYADTQHAMAELVGNSYVCNVEGCSANFYGGTTSNVYVPSGTTTSCKYYRHVYSGTASDGEYTLSIKEASLPTGTVSPNTIFGDDDRVPEKNTDMKTGICFTSNRATGFVVGDHTIATAAHCVLNNNGWRSNFYVQFPDVANVGNSGTAGYVNDTSPKYYAVQAHVDKTYYNYCMDGAEYYHKAPYDYALITVAEDLSDRYHFDLGIPYDVYNSNYTFLDYNIYVTGYPVDKESNGTHYLYTGVGKMCLNGSTYENELRYNTDMINGNSGSPVYIKESYDAGSSYGEFNTVVAINVAQDPAVNSGVIMKPIRVKFYKNNNQASYN